MLLSTCLICHLLIPGGEQTGQLGQPGPSVEGRGDPRARPGLLGQGIANQYQRCPLMLFFKGGWGRRKIKSDHHLT